jgi:hypothetical protein
LGIAIFGTEGMGGGAGKNWKSLRAAIVEVGRGMATNRLVTVCNRGRVKRADVDTLKDSKRREQHREGREPHPP